MPTFLIGSPTIHARQKLLVLRTTISAAVIIAPTRHLGPTRVAYENQDAAIPTPCGPIRRRRVSIVVIIVRIVTHETVSHSAARVHGIHTAGIKHEILSLIKFLLLL